MTELLVRVTMSQFKNIFIVCLYLSVALCDLNLEEGSDCQWEGVNGICVNSRRCMTTLATREPKQPVCSTLGEETIICCTDCDLVDDTSKAVIVPTGQTSIFWKDGRKARDHCLDYWHDLPYSCSSDGGFYAGIGRSYDETSKCHRYSTWGVGGSPPMGLEPAAMYPHQSLASQVDERYCYNYHDWQWIGNRSRVALLGFGENLNAVSWLAGGAIISDRYVLTAAHVTGFTKDSGALKFISFGAKKRSPTAKDSQILEIESIIKHPQYKGNTKYDIALLKTKRSIQFTRDVLPACLPSEAIDDDNATVTTWTLPGNSGLRDDSFRGLLTQKYSTEECTKLYEENKCEKYDAKIQMCYGNRHNLQESNEGFPGEPLMVNNYLSNCFYTIIGVTSSGHCSTNLPVPAVYTRVSYFLPWIESIVWP